MELINKKNFYSTLSNVKKLPILAKLSPNVLEEISRKNIVGFKASQKLAYECAVEAAKRLKVGMTEKSVSKWMDKYLQDRGVRGGFHQPLAWFGERTRFKGIKKETQALPSNRRLKSETEPVIIDIAPILDGYVSDIGFGFTLAPNPEFIKAREFLLELRNDIPEMFASSLTVAEIWQEIDNKIKDRGYQNCHKKYILSVLGHRVYHIPFGWPLNYAGMYSVRAYWALASRGFFPELLSPYHKGEKIGVWAIEPHLGHREENFGMKFEEILVVEKDKAYWLQDNVPHVALPDGLY
ncbi:MAG: M24 family metallopeptidase [Bdellovibrionota bacterium]